MNKYKVYVSRIDENDTRTIYANNSYRAKELAWQQVKDMRLGWIAKKQFMDEAKVFSQMENTK